MCRDKLEGVSAAKVCVSESACVPVIKAVYGSFTGGKVPNRFEILTQTKALRGILARRYACCVVPFSRCKKGKKINVLSANVTENQLGPLTPPLGGGQHVLAQSL